MYLKKGTFEIRRVPCKPRDLSTDERNTTNSLAIYVCTGARAVHVSRIQKYVDL